jgi:hypothetical protein
LEGSSQEDFGVSFRQPGVEENKFQWVNYNTHSPLVHLNLGLEIHLSYSEIAHAKEQNGENELPILAVWNQT